MNEVLTRPIKGLKERFAGKSGQLRNNLMGKRCLEPDTRVLMWSGDLKCAKNIRVGDTLVGEDGNKRTVIDTFTGKDIMYSITNLRTKEFYTVNKNHLLTLIYPDQGKIRWSDGYTTIRNGHKHVYGFYTMRWYNRMTEKFEKTKYTTDVLSKEEAFMKIVELQRKIDTSPIINMSVLTYLNLHENYKTLLFIYKLDTPVLWETTSKENSNTNSNYMMGVEYAKKINDNPSLKINFGYYNTSSRFSILKGIIDTIGVVPENKSKIQIKSVYNSELKFLVESLGLNINIFSDTTKHNHINWNSNTDKNNFVLHEISGNISKINPEYKDTSNFLDIFSVELANLRGDYCGFEINGDSKMFVLGDFHITHNCEQTGRTVIGPDPTLKMGQLAIPREIANNLTIPEKVSNLNYDRLTKIVNSGMANYVLKNGNPTKYNLNYALFRSGTELIYGDEIVRPNGDKEPVVIKVITGKEKLKEGDKLKRNGVFVEDLKYPEKKNYVLNIGDVVERKLQDNDWVILNPKFYTMITMGFRKYK